jgi:large subunit ribosomal protein L35
MSKPVYRYMLQKQFEKQPKSKLMERLTQMNVIPDILAPGLEPTVEVAVKLSEGQVEPGVFLKPEQVRNLLLWGFGCRLGNLSLVAIQPQFITMETNAIFLLLQSIEQPQIDITNFHTESRLYTLMMVDPDSPDVANQAYQQHCHWLLSNISLSATSPTVQGGDAILKYQPPHPQKGTKYHRYTLIAFEQPNEGQEKVTIENITSRDGFDVKSLAQQYGLKPTGATFFRQEWDQSVSKIYEQVLKTQEPVYGKPPKVQRYIQRAVYY